MQNPVFHNPGQVPWKEWELEGGTQGSKRRAKGYIETAFTRDLAVVEAVYAQWTRYPLSSWCDLVDEGYDLIPLTYPTGQHPNKLPRYGEIEVRPNLVRWNPQDGHKVAWGSHQEQDYRAFSCSHTEMPDYSEAVEHSRKLLLEYLSPRQRIDLLTTHSFYVKGTLFGEGYLYRLEYLNGVQLGKAYARTRQGRKEYIFRILGSHCYHGNVWLPGYDMMLTTLLLLQENEETFIAESNTSIFKKACEVPL